MFTFTPQEPPVAPVTKDPFVINGDGSYDLNIDGKITVDKASKFKSNLTVDGELVVQGVNILDEIESINQSIQSINSSLSALQSAISSLPS